MGNIKIPEIDTKEQLKAVQDSAALMQKRLDEKNKQISSLIWINSQLEAKSSKMNTGLGSALFPDDQKIIENAVQDYPISSYQIGEIARFSALLYERGFDVERHLIRTCKKYGVSYQN